jgi:hypothetical protein
MVLLAAHLFVKQMKHAMVNRAIVTKQLVSVEMDPLSLIVQVCNNTFMHKIIETISNGSFFVNDLF